MAVQKKTPKIPKPHRAKSPKPVAASADEVHMPAPPPPESQGNINSVLAFAVFDRPFSAERRVCTIVGTLK